MVELLGRARAEEVALANVFAVLVPLSNQLIAPVGLVPRPEMQVHGKEAPLVGSLRHVQKMLHSCATLQECLADDCCERVVSWPNLVRRDEGGAWGAKRRPVGLAKLPAQGGEKLTGLVRAAAELRLLGVQIAVSPAEVSFAAEANLGHLLAVDDVGRKLVFHRARHARSLRVT